jgi:hypothetical protein
VAVVRASLRPAAAEAAAVQVPAAAPSCDKQTPRHKARQPAQDGASCFSIELLRVLELTK